MMGDGLQEGHVREGVQGQHGGRGNPMGEERNKLEESTEQEDRAENHSGVRDGGVENSATDEETNQEDISEEGVGVDEQIIKFSEGGGSWGRVASP